MAELKNACKILSLPDKGKKGELIERIIQFVQTGKVKELLKIPARSMAKDYPHQSLSAKSLMLYGGYKNDLQTRTFFKKLIGSHFHFTAFGVDWLNERWLQGNPPTYQEFADYWVAETDRRKRKKAEPKQEWAYINFLQRMNKEKPELEKADLMREWKKLQKEKAKVVHQLLNKVIKIIKFLL